MSKKPNDYIELTETRPQSSYDSYESKSNSYIDRKNGYQSVDLYSNKSNPRGLASTSFNDSNSYIDMYELYIHICMKIHL